MPINIEKLVSWDKILCESEEEYEMFSDALESHGYKWRSGTKMSGHHYWYRSTNGLVFEIRPRKEVAFGVEDHEIKAANYRFSDLVCEDMECATDDELLSLLGV